MVTNEESKSKDKKFEEEYGLLCYKKVSNEILSAEKDDISSKERSRNNNFVTGGSRRSILSKS